jgi:hypothetical protein
LTETPSRIWLVAAMVVASATVTATANLWVMGPGTTFQVNGYRFPLFEFNQEISFGNGDNLFAMISGWRDAAPTAAWSSGNQAELEHSRIGWNR